MWIGGEFGLEQFDQGRFHKIAAEDDKWLRGISGIVETPEGDLWLNAISGIFHIRKAEISEALKDSAYRVKGEHFGRLEGLSGVANPLRPLATSRPVPIISALRRPIRTASGPAHPQTWLSPYCRLSTRPFGSACCAWLRFWHSFGGCINSECNKCGGRKENFAKPLRPFRRWRGSLDPTGPFNLGIDAGLSIPACRSWEKRRKSGQLLFIPKIGIELYDDWAQALPVVSRSRRRCASAAPTGSIGGF